MKVTGRWETAGRDGENSENRETQQKPYTIIEERPKNNAQDKGGEHVI